MIIELEHRLGRCRKSGLKPSNYSDLFRLLAYKPGANAKVVVDREGLSTSWKFSFGEDEWREERIVGLLGSAPSCMLFDEILICKGSGRGIYRFDVKAAYEIDGNAMDLKGELVADDSREAWVKLNTNNSRPSFINTDDGVNRALAKKSWVGSMAYSGNISKVSIDRRPRISEHSSPNASSDVVSYDIQLDGVASGQVFIMAGKGHSLRHRDVGDLDDSKLDSATRKIAKFVNSRVDQRTDLKVVLELNCEVRELYCELGGGLFWSKSAEGLDSLVDSALVQIQNDDDFDQLCRRVEEISREEEERKLQQRINRAKERTWVSCKDDRNLFLEPQSEIETVCVFMQIQALGKLPFHLRVFEYTPQEGIDALANFKWPGQGYELSHQPVEFENKLSSFFQHQHPVRQVAMIIAWCGDQGHLPVDKGYTLQQCEHSDVAGLKELRKGNERPIPVFILEDYLNAV